MKFHDNEQFKYSTMYRHMIVMNIWDYARVSGWHLKFEGATIHFKQFNILYSSAFDKKLKNL
jgi:hypothetical protein